MAKANLQDPVDEGKDKAEEDSFEEEMKAADPERLDLDEIGSLSEAVVATPHPFASYPIGRKVKVGKMMVSKTHIVILKDPGSVFQDPSGRGVAHNVIAKDKAGNDIRPVNADDRFLAPKIAKRTKVNLKTSHSRVTRNYDDGSGQHMDWVFDQTVMVGDREMVCCVVPPHSARAQIFIRLDKGKIQVDKRYMLADIKQGNKLRRVFKNIYYQQLAGERAAQKFESDQGDE